MLAINPKIKQKAEDIRKKIFGSEVRESLASGIEAISEDVEATIGRQDYVEEQFQNVIDETTDKDVISAPELIAARNGKSNLKTRLDDEHAQVTAQLQQTAKRTEMLSNDNDLSGRIDNLILDSGTDSSVEVQDARQSLDGTNYDLLSQRLLADFNRTARTKVSTLEPFDSRDGDLWFKPKQSSLYEGVKLNGTSSYIDMSEHVDFINGKLSASDRATLEIVVSIDSISSSTTVIGGGHALTASSRYKNLIRAGYDWIGGATSYGSTQYTTEPVRGKLYLTLVYDGTDIIMYEDGVEKSRSSRVGVYNPWDQFVFGRDNYSLDRYLNGTIFDIRLWDKGLTPEEVRSNVGTELTGAEEGLVGYWDLNERAGSVAKDKTLNGLDGTIYNGEWVTSID